MEFPLKFGHIDTQARASKHVSTVTGQVCFDAHNEDDQSKRADPASDKSRLCSNQRRGCNLRKFSAR